MYIHTQTRKTYTYMYIHIRVYAYTHMYIDTPNGLGNVASSQQARVKSSYSYYRNPPCPQWVSLSRVK